VSRAFIFGFRLCRAEFPQPLSGKNIQGIGAAEAAPLQISFFQISFFPKEGSWIGQKYLYRKAI
jgi:hypothetical protein